MKGKDYRNDYILFCDVETTGFDWLRNDIISWSGIVTDSDLNILDKKTVLSRPENMETWSHDAEKIHGFSYYQARQFQHRKSACIEILNFLKPFKHDKNIPLRFVDHSVNKFDLMFNHGLFIKSDLQFSMYKVIQNMPQAYESTIKLGKELGFKKNNLKL